MIESHLFAYLIKRRARIDHMLDSLRPREENALIARPIIPDFHIISLKGNELAIAGYPRFDHKHAQLGVGELRYSHIADLEHEHETAIALRHDGVVREDYSPFAFVRPRDLGENDAGHESLNEYPETRLQHEEEDREWTLFCNVTQSVADCVLRFY